MICRTSLDRTAAASLAAAFILLTFPALGQSIWPKPPAEAATDAADTDDSQRNTAAKTEAAESDDILKDVDVSKLDWSQLNVDASAPGQGPAAKTGGAKGGQGGSALSWSNNSKANGGADVSVKQSVWSFWDTRVGADMRVTREPTTMSELLAEKASNGGSLPQSGGSAWAAITAPGAAGIWDKTAVEARIDPQSEQSKLGTSISKQVLLSDFYALTRQNGYNVTQQGLSGVPGLPSRPTTRSCYG